jgi:trehalose-phosphatase
MQPKPELVGISPRLWHWVAHAQHRILMLDYDGTLAPFVVDRLHAPPLERSIAAVSLLAASDHTSVAIVSGRPLDEFTHQVAGIPVTFVGEHGWERLDAEGTTVRRALDRLVVELLAQAERAARAAGLGDRLEVKRSSLVLHTRGLDVADATALEERAADVWRASSATGRLVLERMDGGLELRAHDRNKGTAALALLAETKPGTLGVFVGDDVTDEDAFEVVRDWGFGVRVGVSDRPTFALGQLPSVEAVAVFLEEWKRVVESGAPSLGAPREGSPRA